MNYPKLNDLPPPPSGKIGWPWTEQSDPIPSIKPDGNPWPRISVVTPSLNQGKFIEETIRSVLLQSYPDLEYIIMDGGSNDNSVKIIKKYEPWLTYWVSKKDKGQSNAINNGFMLSTGEIMGWLNSDDFYNKNALSKTAIILDSKDGFNWLVGATNIINEKGKYLKIQYPPDSISNNTFFLYQKHWISQPSTFWNRKIWQQSGPLDEDLSYVMDVNLFFSFFLKSQPIITQYPISFYRQHNESKTVGQLDRSNKEFVDWFVKKFFITDHITIEEKRFCYRDIINQLVLFEINSNRISNHLIIGNLIKFWKKYVNRNFNVF